MDIYNCGVQPLLRFEMDQRMTSAQKPMCPRKMTDAGAACIKTRYETRASLERGGVGSRIIGR